MGDDPPICVATHQGQSDVLPIHQALKFPLRFCAERLVEFRCINVCEANLDLPVARQDDDAVAVLDPDDDIRRRACGREDTAHNDEQNKAQQCMPTATKIANNGRRDRDVRKLVQTAVSASIHDQCRCRAARHSKCCWPNSPVTADRRCDSQASKPKAGRVCPVFGLLRKITQGAGRKLSPSLTGVR